jgi:CheY-like chemotaxis protein
LASILLIDDDETLRKMTAALLTLAGYEVDTAADGKAGLALYKDRHHDLVITDIVMFGMSGIEVIEELRRTMPRPRIIAFSGNSDYSVPVFLPTAKRLGAERILAKPVEREILLRTIADVLAEPAKVTVSRAEVRDDPVAGDASGI